MVSPSPYATFYRWPATAVGTYLDLAEGNGGVGQLQSSPAIGGPWAVISNAANPHISSNEPEELFRVKVQ